MQYKLMIKTHNLTGLKYLCKTAKYDPDKYLGSGKYWLAHLKKYGNNVSNETIFETDDLQSFADFAFEFSVENNVDDCDQWANLILETGLDGGITHNDPYWLKRYKHSEETKIKIGEAAKISSRGNTHNRGRKHTKQFCENVSKSRKGMKFSEEHKKNISLSQLGKKMNFSDEDILRRKTSLSKTSKKRYKCSVCLKEGNAGQIGRYHKECMKDPTFKRIEL